MTSRTAFAIPAGAMLGCAAGVGISLFTATALPRTANAADATVGVNLPLVSTPFWQAYNNYVPIYAKQLGLAMLPVTDAKYDLPTQLGEIKQMIAAGAGGILTTPVESAGISPALKAAAAKQIPVVTVDVAPAHGPVAMVVRVDNRAYGQKACAFIGERVKTGAVVQIMGDLASVNGRDRGEGFRTCMKGFPNLKVLEIPANWDGAVGAKALDGLLSTHSDIKGIYLHAGGAFLNGTLATLKAHNLLVPAGTEGHVVIFSNDGSAEEYDAIRKGEIDATVSQPADMYAKYGLMYLKQAMAGQTFKPGPTDHDSVIVEVAPGVLEDQLPAPEVTKANVDDKSLWGNQS